MKKKEMSVVMMCVVALIISVSLPCVAHAAMVATDNPLYAPGESINIIGVGWQPFEFVSLVLYDSSDLVNPYSILSNAQADDNGTFFVVPAYVAQAGDEGRAFTLKATGQSSGFLAQATFDDAPHLHFFEDASQNIPRDAFAWGRTVYARADDLFTSPMRPCWQVVWRDPYNNVVETHNLDASLSNNRNDSFVIPAWGPSGVWKAELYRPSNANACGSVPSFSLRSTLTFDVARIVIIGAHDSYITSHSPDFNSNSSLLSRYLLDVNNDSNDTEKTFLRFNLAPLGNVFSAKVRMRLLIPPVLFGSPRTYNINRVTGPWDVNTITWNNQPGVANPFTDQQSIPTGLSAFNSYVRWDVTSDVVGTTQEFVHHGWRVVDSQGQDPEGIFYSTESNTLLGGKIYGPVLLLDAVLDVPTMTEWGMIIFVILAGLGSVLYLRRQRRV